MKKIFFLIFAKNGDRKKKLQNIQKNIIVIFPTFHYNLDIIE